MVERKSVPCNKLYILLVIFTLLVWIACLIVGGIFMSDGYENLDNDLVNETSHEDNDFEITPASPAFSIWFLIYLWQAVFFLYCFLSAIPKLNLRQVPMLVFPFYILNNCCGMAWTIVAEKDMYWAGVGSIAGLPITLYVCLFISIHSSKSERQQKYFVYTYMVHNAWAIYAGWTTVATLLYLGITLIHGSPGLGQQITGTMMLGILLLKLIVFCSLELTVLDKYLRHIWTHYIALAVAIVGSIVENWDPENRNSIMTVGIAGFVSCAFLVKLMKMICCRTSEICGETVMPDHGATFIEKKYLENHIKADGV